MNARGRKETNHIHSPFEAQKPACIWAARVGRLGMNLAFTEEVDLRIRREDYGVHIGFNGLALTHSPRLSFSIASSMAGWKTPLPRNVSMTWPYRKNLEKTLSGDGDRRSLCENEKRNEKTSEYARICEHYVRGTEGPSREARVAVIARWEDTPNDGLI